MEPGPDRRRFSRVVVSLETSLATTKGEPLSGEVTDLSVVGLGMTTTSEVPVGTPCRVQIWAGDDVVEVRGSIVRRQGSSLGVRFDEVPYSEFERLRQLLLRHADEPALIDEELTDRLGFVEDS